MKRSLFIAALAVTVLLFNTSCTKKIEIKQSKVEKTYSAELTNITSESLYGKLKLMWDIDKKDEVDKVLIRTNNGIDKRLFFKLDSSENELIFDSRPMAETKITFKIKYKNGKYSDKKTIIASSNLEAIIKREDEFIDIDSETVKFLFNTNIGANIKFYLGESADKLNLVKEEKNYNYKNGLKVSNLLAEKEYFYKIEIEYEGVKKESKINKFNKIEKKTALSTPDWAKEAVFYEIFIRSFRDSNGDRLGDFKGIADKMEYLKDLGIDALWLMPSFKSSSYHGYDIENYREVEKDYGSMKDFEEFIKIAHKNNIKVILDLVINHTSWRQDWFEDSRNINGKYRNYYTYANEFDDISENGEWGQSLWHQTENKGEFVHAVFWGGMPDLNFRNYKVRTEMKDIAKFWIDKGVDGFRLDASKHIDEYDAEVTHSWWEEFNYFVKKENPNAFIVGENWDNDKNVVAPFLKTMDSSFNFGLSTMIQNCAIGRKGNYDFITEVNNMRNLYSTYNKEFIDSTFITNHDMSRIASLVKGNKNKIKFAANLLFTLPGNPFLYYGEELGQLGKKPDMNIREPFEWTKEVNEETIIDIYKSLSNGEHTGEANLMYTKSNDGISLEEEKDDENSIYNHYKKLIKIRKENKDLFNGEYTKFDTGIDGLYAYDVKGSNNIKIIHNFEKEIKEFDINIYKGYKDILNDVEIKDNKFILKPFSTIILKK